VRIRAWSDVHGVEGRSCALGRSLHAAPPMRAHARRLLGAMGPLLGLGALVLLLLLPPPMARACGGFFCNQPDNPFDLPVAQTAENVLFAMERDASGQFKLEAHVQIFYTGPADKFSWVVPVDSAPELGVGSNAVFSALLNATRPSFGLDWRVEGTCREPPGGYPPPSVSSPTPGAGGSFDAASAAGDGGVTVSFRGDVGPYDAAVIKSDDPGNPAPLIDWLNANMYFVTPEGARLIAEYVKENKHFVAIKLLSQAGVNEIQPLVMRFLGPGPCVPLRLTSIAAIRDLKVNLWVLAEHRVVPDNFFEIVINEARIDWFRAGANYEDLVKAAANEAGGNAFATEYAGPSAMLGQSLYQPGQYDLSAVRLATTPPDALNRLGSFPRDASLLAVLRTHIPVPEVLVKMGIDERTFYNQLGSYWQQYQASFKAFSGAAFADDLEAKIVEPLRKAQALFDKHRKVTRMSTFISPDEMKVDPTFVLNPTLPDVPAKRVATAYRVCGNQEYTLCDAPVRLELRDGQAIWFRPAPQPVCYGPAFDFGRAALDDLPAMSAAWARTSAGEGAKRFDNASEIRQKLAAHNLAVSAPGTGAGGSGGGGGGPDGGAGGSGGRPTTPGNRGSGSGCGCALPGDPGGDLPGLLGTLALLGAGLIGRRARRQRHVRHLLDGSLRWCRSIGGRL
jgi:hypothetical protein